MMRDLVAQVTGSLLRFPEVTVDALGENEVALDTELHGKFTLGRSGLAWLACGPQLEVVHGVTGERFSAYRFSGVSEHPPSVLAVRSFTWLKRSGLLVGLDEDEGSMLCLYDLGLSRVVKAVVIPGRITGIEPLVSYGGASTSTQHLHQSLRWFFGMAAVVTDIGHVLLVDLCLDDLSCTQSELEALDLEVVSKFPSDIPRLREGVIQQGRHLCLQLSSPTGTAATALHYIQRTNQLAVGFSDGYLQLWNMKTLKKEYHSQLEGGRVPVYAFTFQEPENDPRNCCYLWAVQSTQDHVGDVVSLRLLQLAFGERKCLTSGKILYEGLEYCEERYSQDLNGTSFPLRAQATNTRLLSCQTIEKFRPHPDRDDSMNEVASPDTSVSVFSWQVKSYGQGQLSTFIGVFDINRWYHAQMPDSLRAGESLQNCPYLAVWSLDSVAEVSGSCPLLDVLVHERSLSRPLPYQSPPPEQFFSPTTYNFDASCLLNAGIVHVTCSGYQKETLCYLKKAAPSLSDGISNGYSRCLMAGLLSSRLADVQPSNLSQEEQLDAILTTAVETSSLGLITGCIKQWTAEEHPGSAANLRYILEWAWNKVVQTKEELDGICAPLYDSSSNFTDPHTLQLLQHSQRLLGNLSTIFHCMLNEAKELTHRGLIGLMNKSMVSSLISQYAQVVLWFCRTGLLPESFDEDVVQISRPFYSFSAIKNYYTAQRQELQRLAKDKWCCDCLMIDGLVSQCGDRLCELWKRDEAGTGQYPPPSLHALLDLYLLENVEESAKHAIVIYLLLDVMYSFPNKGGASVESFPTAFAIPIGLVKLVQGLWLLDHHDHESSVELLLHPATSRSLWSWQHDRVLQVLMCQGKHGLALRYLHVVKPPISCTAHAKLRLSVLLHNRCLVEAWALLRQHANKVNLEELQKFLYETCQELDLMKDLLKLPLGPLEQACLERFLQNTGGFQNRELLMVHYLQQANYVPALQINQTLKMNFDDRDPRIKERSNTRNSILNQYGKVLPRAQRKLAIERAKPYQHAATILREVTRPQPLSAVVKPSATNNVLTKAAFIKNVLTKIQEVWVGKDPTPQPSPVSSPRGLEAPAPVPSPTAATLNIAEAFVGTPINMLNKRMSRLLDLVVQPSSQTSPEAPRVQATPTKPISSWTAPKSGTKAPELSLLQTPQVVKRARVIAAAAPVFSFTPQSILRTGLRPTPVATPSASPGRSATPPLRPKESRITFIEETSSPDLNRNSVHWSNGLAAKDEAEQPQRPPLPPEGGVEVWSEEEEMEREQSFEEKNPTGQAGLKSDSPVKLLRRPSLGHETSQLSVQSDTTLEFHDVPSPGDLVREKLQRETASPRRSEVTVRLPDLSSPAAVAPEETPVQEDQDTSMEEAQEPSGEAQTNTDGEEDDGEEQCEGVAQEFVPKPQTEGNSSQSVVPKVVNHCPEVVTDSKAVCEEAEVSKKTPDPIALPVLMHEESVTDEISISRVPAPQQAISEVTLVAVVPITDSTAEREPEYSEPALHEPLAETAPTPEELLSEPAVTEPVSNETQAEDTRRDESEADELNHKTESDLDDFVERQLFGGDLSHSGNVEATGAWSSFHSDDVTEPAPEDVPVSHTPTPATSSESATSESHSVVSLNDTDELSSAESEEESGAEEEEDSGSEVEIIEEVKGSSVQLQQHPTPALYLEELPPHQDYLREQATAVLSLVSPEQELKVIDGVMDEGEVEGEVVMVGLEPAELVEGDGAVCYTELKPSTTLLVPLELAAEHQDILGAAAFQTRSDDDQPAGHNTFSLMLEAEDGEGEGAIASGLDPNNHLIYNQDMEVVEDLQSQTAANNTHVVCLENAGQDAQECLESFLPEKVDSDAAAEPDLREGREDPAEMIEDVSTGENGNHVHLHDGHESDKVKDSASTEPAEHESQEPEATPADHILPSKEIEMDTTSDVASEAEKHLSDAKKVNESTPSPGKEGVVVVSEDAVTKISPNREETTSEKEKVVRRSPGRKSKRIVTLPLSVAESEKDQEEEQNHSDSKVPSTMRRVTRSSLQPQDVLVPVTPRRSTRKTEPESQVTEEVPLTKAVKASSPARRAPLKTTPRRGRPRTRNADTGSEEEAQEAGGDDDAKPWVRQSSRKKSSIVVAEPVPEESVSELPTRATRSPGRTTRQSSRGLGLGLDSFRRDASEDVVAPDPSVVTPPRSRRKTGVITAEKAGVTVTVDEAQLQSVSRRLTRSRLWSHDEEKEHVLETTVDVEPTNPLTSSLMGRLNDEEDKAGSEDTDVVTQIVRAKRRATRSAAVGPSQDTAADETPKMTTTSRRTRASKASEPATSPKKESSTLPQTRGRKKESAVRNEVVPELLSPPVTRARRAAPDTEDIVVDTGDILVIVEEVKPRKKRSTRARAAAEPPPPVEVNLVSPLGSPAQTDALGQGETDERNAAAPKISLRRKRMMEAIFPKPLTRRKRL